MNKFIDSPHIEEVEGQRAVVLPFGFINDDDTRDVAEFAMLPDEARRVGIELVVCADKAAGRIPEDVDATEIELLGQAKSQEEAQQMMEAARKKFEAKGYKEIKPPK